MVNDYSIAKMFWDAGMIEASGSPMGVFEGCENVDTVKLPKSLRKIGYHAFYRCKMLAHVDIPSGVTEFGVGAFDGSSLMTVTIPEGVINLPDRIFNNCKYLKSVKLPSSLKTIGYNAFEACYSLKTINLVDLKGVSKIESHTFSQCHSLCVVELPCSLKAIGGWAFSECITLRKVVLPPSLETIGEQAFAHCHPEVPFVDKKHRLFMEIPDAVNHIGAEALSDCIISLPTSLSMLAHGRDVIGLLHQVKKVEISSRVNLGLLVRYLASLPKMFFEDMGAYFDDEIPENADKQWVRPFLDPEFKFLVGFGGSQSVQPPKISEHAPVQFVYSPKDLIDLFGDSGEGALEEDVCIKSKGTIQA